MERRAVGTGGSSIARRIGDLSTSVSTTVMSSGPALTHLAPGEFATIDHLLKDWFTMDIRSRSHTRGGGFQARILLLMAITIVAVGSIAITTSSIDTVAIVAVLFTITASTIVAAPTMVAISIAGVLRTIFLEVISLATEMACTLVTGGLHQRSEESSNLIDRRKLGWDSLGVFGTKSRGPGDVAGLVLELIALFGKVENVLPS